MGRSERFEKVFGPPFDCQKPGPDVIQTYDKQLPAALIERWRDVGWCGYGDGPLWVVDPKEFDGILEDWIDVKSGPTLALVFLRTAFADLYFWNAGSWFSLDVHRGRISQGDDDIEGLLDVLCDEKVQERALRRSLFQEAMRRLGRLNRDECYAFVPALALGGPGTADTLQKVKIREHLGFLAQVVLR